MQVVAYLSRRETFRQSFAFQHQAPDVYFAVTMLVMMINLKAQTLHQPTCTLFCTAKRVDATRRKLQVEIGPIEINLY